MDTDLAAVVARHGLQLPDDQIAQLQQYCTLLWDWNTKINLTRHTDYEKFVSRDLLDSMKLAEFLASGETVLDVGTGGGVPGVILGLVTLPLRLWSLAAARSVDSGRRNVRVIEPDRQDGDL